MSEYARRYALIIPQAQRRKHLLHEFFINQRNLLILLMAVSIFLRRIDILFLSPYTVRRLLTTHPASGCFADSRLACESWRGIRVSSADIILFRIPAHPRGAYIRGRLTPATDTDLFLTAYRGGSHLPLIYLQQKRSIAS